MSGPTDEEVEVAIRSMGGEQLAKVHVLPACQVWELKISVQEQLGCPPASQQLRAQTTILEDDVLLSTLYPPLEFTLVLADFDRAYALEQASAAGHEAAVCWLLERSVRDDEERRDMLLLPGLLARAIGFGHEGVCRALLGAAPNAEVQGLMMLEEDDDYDVTALMKAAVKGHAAICRLLLGTAPNLQALSGMVNATNIYEQTALHWAADTGRETCCQALLEAAADADVCRELLLRPCRDDGDTALHLAAHRGHQMICRALLEAAPSPEARGDVLVAQNDASRTALDVAVAEGHEMVAQMLRDAAV